MDGGIIAVIVLLSLFGCLCCWNILVCILEDVQRENAHGKYQPAYDGKILAHSIDQV